MSKENKYTSSIKDMPLMFSEMKRTALLICEGKSNEEIVSLSLTKNIYQLEKEKRRRDVPLRMIKRLSTIGQPLVEIIASGYESEAKLIAFLSFMKADRLLFEYMYEVYADKFNTGHTEITDKDFIDFIDRKAHNDETVAKWSNNNLASVRGKIKSSLCEAGLAKRKGDYLLIQKPIIDDALRCLIISEDMIYARAMLMEV